MLAVETDSVIPWSIAILLCSAGGPVQQVAMERLTVADYDQHADVAVHAATLQLQLDGPLQVGGVVFVLHVPPESWHARRGNARPDFFVSTREVIVADVHVYVI